MPRCYMVKKISCNKKYIKSVSRSFEEDNRDNAGLSFSISRNDLSISSECRDTAVNEVKDFSGQESLISVNLKQCDENPVLELQDNLDGKKKNCQDTEEDTVLFKNRSAAETEAAHDLLELSRSLPPLPQPSVAIGPHNIVGALPNEVYQSTEPSVYHVNTIVANDLPNYGIYQQHQTTGVSYQTGVSNAPTGTIVHQPPGGVIIPFSPVQEILFTYTTSSLPSPIITQQAIGTIPPLTPPTSECSSDTENNNPNAHLSQSDKEVQTMIEHPELKVAVYTYDTLLVTDGRSKNKKSNSQPDNPSEVESFECLEVPKTGRYICCECGKQYATSSNLSRHKQTHRSIDSQSAKKCMYCGKAYVSMPALAMHVLTHKLTHSCGICGKMFSRPWLLQGHLRSHTGEKPYGCAHCGKAFADRSNLRAHMQTHSIEKNHECSRCHKTFALKSYLNKHLESACQGDNCDENSNDTGGLSA